MTYESVLAPRLAWFAAVAREEHVTRAAELLGVPQPTLSRGIARLEADLGVPLFTRAGRGVRLTRQGRTLLAYAEQALGVLGRAYDDVTADADPSTGSVAFGFLHSMGPYAVPGLLRDFRAVHPGIRFALVQGQTDAMLDRLRTGDLDLCLLGDPSHDPELDFRALDEQRLDLVVPTGHRLAAHHGVRLADAADETFVCMEPGYGLRRIFDDLCAQAGFVPRIAFEGEESETLRGLVAAGLGVALLPAPERPRPGTVRLDILEPRASRTIGLAWPRERRETPPVRLFREFVLSRGGLFTRPTRSPRP